MGLCDVKNCQNTHFGNTSPPPQPLQKHQKNHLCNIILLKCIFILSHFHPSEKTHPSLNPPCRSPCSFCSKLMTFSRSSMAFFPPTPGSLPSLSWLNEPPDDVTVAFAWCEKKQVQLVMYGFFFMVYCCSTWTDVDLFQNNFCVKACFTHWKRIFTW